jgi:hypothetical protein
MSRALYFLCCFALLVLLFLFLSALPPLLRHVVLRLPWGWISFLCRVLPEVSLNWSGIGMVVVCSAVAIGGLHWLCSWLYSHRRASAGEPGATVVSRWSWRWTFALYTGFWILFCIVMGAAGLMREVSWLMASHEPLHVERISYDSELRLAAMEMQNALVDGGGDLAKTRAAFLGSSMRSLSPRPTAWERHHALFFEDGSGRLTAVALFPRDPQVQSKAGFMILNDGIGGIIQPMTNLPTVIARQEASETNTISNRK